MIDPSAIATGVATGVVTQKGLEAANNATRRGPTHEEIVVQLLTEIRDGVAPPEKTSIEESFNLQPYPSEYIIPDDFRQRAHVCIYFFASTPCRFDGLYGGSIQKTEGPGWVQIDMPGRLSTTDASNHFVTVSYRNDALGAAF